MKWQEIAEKGRKRALCGMFWSVEEVLGKKEKKKYGYVCGGEKRKEGKKEEGNTYEKKKRKKN